MEEIQRFVLLAQTDRFTITDLCEQFRISRKRHASYRSVCGRQGGIEARGYSRSLTAA